LWPITIAIWMIAIWLNRVGAYYTRVLNQIHAREPEEPKPWYVHPYERIRKWLSRNN
jgi:hypothetical protein